ncbi:DNA-binding domain-containing protein [Pseudomarimonas salicorniae]|uniref:DNA-binding domain-containing protein n=1 Tax=Pseudomarimonas salicorniae TaxID=2933270 RepID=A0ABT0GLG7_9GAMM|nr:putative DNA-binding domain-containing protein [Lysobacter sp. CAU 1642]MCK7595258.1 putative DNA-binding domain-containing protein [Lysobacter sp. CAU 1642]
MRPLEAPPRLREQQVAFAAHLRDPASAPPPEGIEDRRMAIYRDLFYNSLEGLLAGNFPVIRRLRGDDSWHALVRDFYREHACHTPLFTEIGREFLRYLERRQEEGRGDPPFLLELAHYEWVELALSLEEVDEQDLQADREADLLGGVPLLSPLAWPLAYRFPVQQIREDFQPAEPPPQPTFLLVVRDGEGEIRFKSLDPLGYHLLQAVGSNEQGASGRQLLQALGVAAGVDAASLPGFIENGSRLLQALRQREVILGTRIEPAG